MQFTILLPPYAYESRLKAMSEAAAEAAKTCHIKNLGNPCGSDAAYIRRDRDGCHARGSARGAFGAKKPER